MFSTCKALKRRMDTFISQNSRQPAIAQISIKATKPTVPEASIPPDKMLLALLSAFSCLVSELNKRGAIDVGSLIENVQATAVEHRSKGDPAEIADALHRVSEYLQESVPDRPLK